MNKQIEELALRVADSVFTGNCDDNSEILQFAETFLAELAKQSEPVAYLHPPCEVHSENLVYSAEEMARDGVSTDGYIPLGPITIPAPDLVAEIERLKAEYVKELDLISNRNYELRQQLSAAQADNEQLVKSLEEVETKYFALLKEKDAEAEGFKAEGDMYGWNFHTGVRMGAVEMHLYMTKLLKLAAAHKARQGKEES